MTAKSNPLVAAGRTIWRALPFTGSDRPLVTVIQLGGVIGASAGPGQRGLTLSRVEDAIEAAFKPHGLKAVALSINSPGGSPVQSRLIYNAIRVAAKEKKIPVLSFIEDVGASGGYILALAGDEIYADESSIVGSIGVIAAAFGFQEAIARFGIERRVHTAGASKSQLDPFKPENPEDVERLKKILDDLHKQFVALVKERRGDKVNDGGDIFSGAFWTAEPARQRGLIDGTGHLGEFLRARFGENVKVKKIRARQPSLLKRLMGGASGFGGPISGFPGSDAPGRGIGDFADAAIESLETRAIWARFGL